jgi:tellurite resistance protein TerC
MFLQSARALETSGVIVSVALFIWMYGYLIDWHLQKAKHGLLLLTWLGVGMASFTTVHMFYGREESAGWISGYLLELVFSIENVFVFHVIAQSFKAPARLTQKALFCVILGQMIFQAIFFMGLTHWLHQSRVLPYILGMWLMYVGWEAARMQHEHESNLKEIFAYLMGSRLTPGFPEDGRMFGTTPAGTWNCTMLLPLTISLFVVDVLLEVDVTLTKIETLDKSFMCFSSSVIAACAVPELYFVARTAFEKFHSLRYGVAFALVFYGLQLLLHRFFELPALAGIVIVLFVMAVCIVVPEQKQMTPDSSKACKQETRDEDCFEVDL